MQEANDPFSDYFKSKAFKNLTNPDSPFWGIKEKVELIKGRIFKVSKSSNTNHQRVLSNINTHFLNHFRDKSCHVFFSPFDVILPLKSFKKVNTLVQPDLCVICDESKIDAEGCNGPPDLIVEVLSPGQTTYEMRIKYTLYEESGIKEYWIIEPANKTILIYTLVNQKYIGLQPFTESDEVCSQLFPDLRIQAFQIFGNTN